MIFPIIILGVVFVLIAIRQIGNVKLQIWQIMLFGALAVLIIGGITPRGALVAIDYDIILFLFGMFVIGVALEESGYLSHLSYKFFKRAKKMNSLFLFVLFGFGLLSAILMNDTVAIIGTSVILFLAKKHNIQSKPLLIALIFAVTIGSVMSPIGNPQNLIIAVKGGIPNPFVTFFKYLFLPTMLNLFFAFLLLKLFYKSKFANKELNHSPEQIKDKKLAQLSKVSLLLILLLILLKIGFTIFRVAFDFRLTYISIISMLPILLFSKKRFGIIKNVDWHTLVFFASMFILMQSVWDTGFFQTILSSLEINILSVPVILLISVLFSQFISNVPLVALFLPMLTHLGASTKELIALAAGSTIAGNLFILGAASNIIIIQNLEKKTDETLSFFEFAKIGVLMTIINILVYWFFFLIIQSSS